MGSLHVHPYVKANSLNWKLWRDLYEGDHATMVASYLWRHENERKAEGTELLKTRQERTRYLNLQEVIVSIWRSIFFRKEGAPDEILAEAIPLEERENIDRDQNSIQTLLSEKLFTDYILYGTVCVLADAPQGEAASAQDELNGRRPYLKHVEVSAIKDWQKEADDPARYNRLNYFRYEYIKESPRLPGVELERYWYSDEYYRDPQTGIVTVRRYKGAKLADVANTNSLNLTAAQGWALQGEPIELKLKEIPVVLWLGKSWVKDASQEILRHFNLRSALDNVNHYQGYEKLFIKGGSSMNEEQRKALAEYIIGLLQDGQDVISIAPTDPIGLQKAVSEALVNALKVGLNQLRALPADSQVGVSAESLEEQRKNTMDLVLSSIKEIEQIINQALGFYMQFKDGKYSNTPFEGKFDLSKEITEPDINSAVQRYQALGDVLAANPEWELAHLRAIVKAEDYGETETETILEALQPRTARRPVAVGGALSRALNGDSPTTEIAA